MDLKYELINRKFNHDYWNSIMEKHQKIAEAIVPYENISFSLLSERLSISSSMESNCWAVFLRTSDCSTAGGVHELVS